MGLDTLSPSLVITRLLIPKSIPMALSVGGNGWIVGSSNLIECQRPEGCNLTVTVLGSQLSGICLDHRRRNGELISAYEIERTKKLNNDLAQLQQEEASERKEREKEVLLEVAKSQEVDAVERMEMLRTAMEQGLINQIEYSEAYKSIIAEQNKAVLDNEKSTFQQRQEALTAMLKAGLIS